MDSMEKDLENVLKNHEQRKALAEFISSLKKKEDDWKINIKYCIDSGMGIDSCNNVCTFSSLTEDYDYNVFETETECERWAKKLNAMHKLRLIANHLNGDWRPNWASIQYKRYISHNEGIIVVCNTRTQNYGIIYFESEEAANKAIELMGEQSLKDLFEIE